MGGGLKGIYHDKINFDTSMNSCKGPPSLEEAWNPDAVISVVSYNYGSECNKDIVKYMDDSDDGNVKPSSPSGMWGLMQMLFIFGVEYIYWWGGLWLFLMSIMIFLTLIIIFDVGCDYFGRELWWCLSFFLSMWCIFYLLILQGLISQRENQQFEVDKKWRGLRFSWVVVFSLRKRWVPRINNLCQEMRIRLGGGSVSVMKRGNIMKKRWVLVMKRVIMMKR